MNIETLLKQIEVERDNFDDLHIVRFFSSFVAISKGKVIKLTDPYLEYCPLVNILYDGSGITIHLKYSFFKRTAGWCCKMCNIFSNLFCSYPFRKISIRHRFAVSRCVNNTGDNHSGRNFLILSLFIYDL